MSTTRRLTSPHRIAALLGLGMFSLASTTFGELIATEFWDYTPGATEDLTLQTPTGFGWDGGWVNTEGNEWWGVPHVIANTPEFPIGNDGDQVWVPGNAYEASGGRITRSMANPATSGQVWFAYVGGAQDPTPTGDPAGPFATNSTQFWIASGTTADDGDPETIDDPDIIRAQNIIAGFRHDQGAIEYINVAKGIDEESDPLEGEVGGGGEFYKPFDFTIDATDPENIIKTVNSVAPGPLLWVGMVDLDASPVTVSYWVFLPGDDPRDPSTATYTESMELAANRDLTNGIDGVAMFTVGGAESFVGGVRIGTTLEEVTPTFNCVGDMPAARGTVNVDGVIDDAWANVAPIPVDGLLNDAANIPATGADDYTGTMKSLWDGSNLYFLFEVQDDDVRVDNSVADNVDNIEVFMDLDYSRNFGTGWLPVFPNRAYDLVDDAQFVFRLDSAGANGLEIVGEGGNPDGVRTSGGNDANIGAVTAAYAQVTGGYVVEVCIDTATAFPLSSFSPAVGSMIGLDVAINDRDDNGGTIEQTRTFFCDTENNVWNSPWHMGTLMLTPSVDPIMAYYFDDLTEGADVVGAGTAGNGWAGAWEAIWTPPWSNPYAAEGGPAAIFGGDLAVQGNTIIGRSGGRVGREFSTTWTSGSLWVSSVIGPGTLSSQMWLGDYSLLSQNDSSGILCGFRSSSGQVQVIDVTEEAGENYANTGVFLSGPVLVVINIDWNTGTVGYWLFESGKPIDPAQASFVWSGAIEGTRSTTLSGIASAYFNSPVWFGNLLIGDSLGQVVPSSGEALQCPAAAYHVPTDLTVTVDGTVEEAWANAYEYSVELTNLAESDAAPTSAQDYTGGFKAMWDDTALYLLVEVTDDDVRTDNSVDNNVDNVELFMDLDYSRGQYTGWGGTWPNTAYDTVDDAQFQLILDDAEASGVLLVGQDRNPAGLRSNVIPPLGETEASDDQLANITVASATTANGYVVEFCMPWSAFTETTFTPAMMERISLDVNINDRDDNGGTVEQSRVFFCDETNTVWGGAYEMATVYLLNETPIFLEVDLTEFEIDLEGDSDFVSVSSNLPYAAWEATPDQSWITVDGGSPGTGNGDIDFTVEESTDLYARSGRIDILNARVNITQEGMAPADMQAILPSATAGTEAGTAETVIGTITYDDYPWVESNYFNWAFLSPLGEGFWAYVWDVDDWWYTSEALNSGVAADSAYFYSLGGSVWVYFAWVEGNGGWVYNFSTGTWTKLFNADGSLVE